MYAQLGNIVFEALKGFESLSDKRETQYAEHALIKGKPLLEKVGESLIEFSGSISFHVAFCNPEDEYKKLNDVRISGEVLPFIYGNSFIEGDFVLTTLERTFNQTDSKGNFISITCNIVLKEFISLNTSNLQQERDKANAFAISANRPLPANPNTQPANPSLAVAINTANVSKSLDAVNSETNNLNKTVNNANSAPPISKAQAFLDKIPTYTQKINSQLTIAQTSLAQLTNLLSLYSSLGVLSPDLATTVTNANSAISSLQTQNSIIASLPNPVTTIPTAISVLNELLITTNLVLAFEQTIKDLKVANSKIVIALATKKVIT